MASEEQLALAAGRVDGGEAGRSEARGIAAHDRESIPAQRDQDEIGSAQVQGHHRLAPKHTALKGHAGSFAHREGLGHRDTEGELPARDPAQPALCLGGAEAREGDGHHDARREKGSGADGPSQGFGDEGRVEQAQPAASLGLGNQDAGDAQLRKSAPERRIVGTGLLAKLAHPRDRHLILEEAAQGLLEQELILGESEVHVASLC
jgi:hypothetical protein